MTPSDSGLFSPVTSCASPPMSPIIQSGTELFTDDCPAPEIRDRSMTMIPAGVHGEGRGTWAIGHGRHPEPDRKPVPSGGGDGSGQHGPAADGCQCRLWLVSLAGTLRG